MGKLTRTHIPIYEARPRHRLLPSRPSPVFLAIARQLSPAYLRFILKFHHIFLHQPETLLSAIRQFQQGDTRLIFAFRHPYGDEPQLLQHVFDCLLPRVARKSGHPLHARPHVRFVHGYEVALWGDAVVRLALPLSGALPIHHLQADPSGMKRIREVLVNGDCPLALAPEGQVSYRSGTVPRLEPGTARIGFWCAKDLEKGGRREQAVIVPVSVHHAFLERDAKKLIRLLESLETFCGIPPLWKSAKTFPSFQGKRPAQNPGFRKDVRDRLVHLEMALLMRAETHYQSMFGHIPPAAAMQTPHHTTAMPTPLHTAAIPTPNSAAGASHGTEIVARPLSDPDHRQARWDALMETALQVGERMLGLPAHAAETAPLSREALLESRIARVYRIRREGWDRVYPDEQAESRSVQEKQTTQAPLAQSMRHRLTGEAWYAMRHMEFVDMMEYLDTAYLDAENDTEGPSYNRLCETALNLHDLAHRLAGGNITHRANPIRKNAIVLAGTPINLSERLPAYRNNMRAAVQEATDQIRDSFLSLIHTYERRPIE